MRRARILAFLIFLASAAFYGYTEMMERNKPADTAPEITCDEDILEITCEYTDEDLLEGIYAGDAEDGDLMDQVIVGQISPFIKKGESEVIYMVFDSSNQMDSLVRRVRFTDYESPTVSLTDPLIFHIGEGSYDSILRMIEVWDQLDGDLTEWMEVMDYDISFASTGSYVFPVQVTNSYGDTVDLALPVHVQDTRLLDHSIYLNTSLVYADVGEKLDPAEYIEKISGESGLDSGELLHRISWENADTSVPGCSEIHYIYKNQAGEVSGETWLTVIVREQEDA
ncbi:MAG: hypothetical protein Q4B03_08340 [Lachnospiraceae bacterium]|nr:hypothetical protein [Lachnospiraceae bacterium]